MVKSHLVIKLYCCTLHACHCKKLQDVALVCYVVGFISFIMGFEISKVNSSLRVYVCMHVCMFMVPIHDCVSLHTLNLSW